MRTTLRPMIPTGLASTAASTLMLGLVFLPIVLAHGGPAEKQDPQSHGAQDGAGQKDDTNHPPSYFSHPEHAGVMLTHIALMTLAWVIVLPAAVMLSLARSRYTLLVQFVFLAANAVGVLFAIIYNAQTPDLYPNNAHHKIGWIITAVVSAQTFISLVGRAAGAFHSHRKGHIRGGSDVSTSSERHAFIPATCEENGSHYFSGGYCLPHDSGQGSEPNTESLRGSSVDGESLPMPSPRKEYAGDDDDAFEDLPLSTLAPKSAWVSRAAKVVSSRVWKYLAITYKVIDRIILPFGFVAFATGVITCGRFFEGKGIFGGLAHWIKGGVFVWLGLFTLGRWCGSFAEIGWAWNARPRRNQKWRPASEFVESALICFYGCTNIFLEHLGGWGGAWTAQDLEHVSITVLFIGGGALGMLVESHWVRDLLNTSTHEEAPEQSYSDEERERHRRPETYEFSLNPVPALVILLLGIMMSSHTQSTMISSMVHKQWGNLLSGASFARALTYVIIYLKPPKSSLPSRPPTELLTSFGLIAGGIIFMASSGDTVEKMIYYDLDAMFMYTVTMGLVGLLMAWEVILLALKGWAIRKERRASAEQFT